MKRIIKEHAVRRDEILDAAQRLIYSKGYEQMTIQDILDELQIAKGTLYHYFGSKQAVVEALVKRLLAEGERQLRPVVDDPHLPTLAKLQRMFDAISRWKSAEKPLHLAVLRIWYADDNLFVRWNVRLMQANLLKPLIAAIIRQGVAEGLVVTAYPDRLGDVVVSLLQEFVDALAQLFLAAEPALERLPQMLGTAAVYTDAVERVLGAPAGSLSLIDAATLKEWAGSF